MAYNSHIPGQNRVFDYLYDSSHIVPNFKDVQRINSNAAHRYVPVKTLTNYNVMFANISMANRRIICPKYELFPQIGVKKDARNATPFTNKYIYLKNKCNEKYLQFFPFKNPSRDVRGTYRSNIFYHNTNSSKRTTELHQKYIEIQQNIPQKKERNVGAQTLFRESSAQTSPYLPDAIFTDTTTKKPEIIQVANILHGVEQPGNFEVQVIERLRKKRQWEKYFSKISSSKEIKKRQKIFEAFEWEEWLSREKQINEIQNVRFEMVKKIMAKRGKSIRKNFELRLDNSIERIAEKYEKDVIKLGCEYSRNSRKLESKYKKSKEIHYTQGKRNLSTFNDKLKTNKYNFIFVNKFSYKHLEEFSRKIQKDKFIECSMTKVDRLDKPKKSLNEIHQGFNSEKNLKKFYESLQTLNQKLTDKTRKSRLSVTKKQIMETEINNQLTKCISSPSSQEIKDKNVQAISEIHDTVSASGELVSNKIYEEEGQTDTIIEKINHSESTLNIEGEKNEYEINTILNFLNSELKKLQDEKKVQALYLLAEQERIKRENNECEIRRKENKMCRKDNEMYRNMMKASQDTVTTFLENVLIEETQIKANNDARIEIKKLAKKIDLQINKEILKSEAGLSLSWDHAKTVVFDIIDNFLLSEIQKRLDRKTKENENYRYICAADITLNSQIEHIFDTKESAIVEKLVEEILSSEDLLPKIGMSSEFYYEANEAVKDILRLVLAHPDLKVLHDATDKTFPRKTSSQNLLQERILIEKIISKVSVNLKKHQMEEDIKTSSDLSSSLSEDKKSKPGTSVITIPALINLLEFKKETLAKKIAKLVIHREQSFDKEEALEKTTVVKHYDFNKQHEKDESFSVISSLSLSTFDDTSVIQKNKESKTNQDSESESILIKSEVIKAHEKKNNLQQ